MEVKARAPGKIILSGEHAVVHGATAVAAAINLYAYVSIRFPCQSENDNMLKLHLKDMALDFSWPVAKLKETVADCGVTASMPTSCPPEMLKSLAVLVEEQKIPEDKLGLASGASAFLWLYTCIQGFKPATVTVTSELPLGAGLGSSASFCVALSAVLLAISDAVDSDVSHKGWFAFGESGLELLNKWAFEGEKIIHGKPSGLDNTVSTFGNMIKFKSGVLTRMESNMPLKMLITNTKVGRNTKALVASVSERASRHCETMDHIFKAVDSISNELADIIQSPAPDELSGTEKESRIQELMEMNQGLLQSMGVSHASIEAVIKTTLKAKLASKLTGAGGGGCVLTLLPNLLSGALVDSITKELGSSRFQCFTAAIGCKGVEACFDQNF